jgi:hypothetical protein
VSVETTSFAEDVEREAAEAEAEAELVEAAERAAFDGDTEPEPEPEPESETPEPHEPPSDKAAEAAFGKIEKAAVAYGRAVGRALEGIDLALSPCPCCETPGLVLPFRDFAKEEQERRLRVLAYFGEAEPIYRTAEDRALCEKCDGYGNVLSGSRNPMHRIVPCSTCSGLGWTQTSVSIPPLPTVPPPVTLPGQANGTTEVALQFDPWGRPAGSRYYNQVPGYETD